MYKEYIILVTDSCLGLEWGQESRHVLTAVQAFIYDWGWGILWLGEGWIFLGRLRNKDLQATITWRQNSWLGVMQYVSFLHFVLENKVRVCRRGEAVLSLGLKSLVLEFRGGTNNSEWKKKIILVTETGVRLHKEEEGISWEKWEGHSCHSRLSLQGFLDWNSFEGF